MSDIIQVTINEIVGDDKKINCGKPCKKVGSVLGQLIQIYIFCNMQIDGKLVIYADYTCLLFSDNIGTRRNSMHTKEISELNIKTKSFF